MGKHINQEKRFDEVWDSWEWLIQDDLEKMYRRLSAMKNEAQLNGVRNPVIEREMQERFWGLWQKIGKGETA
jgi:hypothetical protein